ncbi:MAG: thioredoxin domain-containing protein [Balneolaceae bacterium]
MKKTLQLFLWIAFAIVVIGALIYSLGGSNSGEEVQASQSDPTPVTILKYSDYQCPACKMYIPLQQQLKADFGDLVTIEYRHFPLRGHQYAQLAAQAAEAARVQGRYREMHDRIFEGQEVWSRGNAESIFIEYAGELGLDQDQFEEDLHSEEVVQIVNRQQAEGERRMVQATPTFFINGQMIRQTPQSYEQFKSLVEMFVYQ